MRCCRSPPVCKGPGERRYAKKMLNPHTASGNILLLHFLLEGFSLAGQSCNFCCIRSIAPFGQHFCRNAPECGLLAVALDSLDLLGLQRKLGAGIPERGHIQHSLDGEHACHHARDCREETGLPHVCVCVLPSNNENNGGCGRCASKAWPGVGAQGSCGVRRGRRRRTPCLARVHHCQREVVRLVLRLDLERAVEHGRRHVLCGSGNKWAKMHKERRSRGTSEEMQRSLGFHKECCRIGGNDVIPDTQRIEQRQTSECSPISS